MEHLYLADLEGMTEVEIKRHIADEYAGADAEKQPLADFLEGYDVVVAYESVGNYGCDSASWFLLRAKDTGVYFEFSGSHCSCFGFEGQFSLAETPLEYLKSDKFSFDCGGYDKRETENQKSVREFLQAL